MNSQVPRKVDVGTCALYSLRRSTRLVTRVYEKQLRLVGLGANQFTTLAILTDVGPKPVTILARILGMDRTTLSRDLRPLERKGYIALSRGPADGRTKLVSLTPSGKATYEQALPLWHKAQATVFTALGEGDWVVTLTRLATLPVNDDPSIDQVK